MALCGSIVVKGKFPDTRVTLVHLSFGRGLAYFRARVGQTERSVEQLSSTIHVLEKYLLSVALLPEDGLDRVNALTP